MSGCACARCRRTFGLWERWRCDCGAPLSWQGGTWAPAGRDGGLWRHASLLPPVAPEARITLGEGATPLLERADVRYKLEFLSPTGSFKDRGACVVASCLRQLAITRAAFDSSGNAGAAMAAYLAASGIEATVFVPKSTSPGKLRQIRTHGARLELVDGDRAAVTARAQRWAETNGAHYAGHLWSPFFVSGLRTVAAELLQDGRPPTSIIMPVGSGSLLLGLYEGFQEARAAGVVQALPRLFGVQSSACEPLVAAFEDRDAPPMTDDALAEGIRIAEPPRLSAVVHAVRDTDGALLSVGSAEIESAHDALALGGLFVEPTAAVAEAGRRRLLEVGALDGEERPVVVLTGSGLKGNQ